MLYFENEAVGIAVKEKRSKKQSEGEGLREAEYKFTGLLTFTLGEHSYSKKVWSDKPQKKIEVNIGKIVLAIFAEVEEKMRLREKRTNNAIRAEKERLERYKLQQPKEKELDRVEVLIKAAEDFKKAKLVREFIEELTEEAKKNQDTKLEEYINGRKVKLIG